MLQKGRRGLGSATALLGLGVSFSHLERTQTLEAPDLSLNSFSGTSHCITWGEGAVMSPSGPYLPPFTAQTHKGEQ